MTAVTIKEAARIVEILKLENDAIVNLIELGSEGSILVVGTWLNKRRWLIARDGSSELVT